MNLNVFDESWRSDRAAEYEADPLNREKAQGYVLVALSDGLGVNNRIESDRIFCPDYNITITPRISKLDEKNALILFVLYAPQWGEELYESSIGVAETPQQAIRVACESFMFTLADAVCKMEKEGEKGADANIATIFGGKTHRWNVYFSDLAATGDAPEADSDVYWERLKKAVIKRLGNQKLCYVKIYVSRSGRKISVDCRVDGLLSEELSALTAKMAEQWKAGGFASHQMFFCIRQEDDTVTEYPYFGPEGRAELKAKVKTAAEMFFAANTGEEYDNLLSDMKEKLGDSTLAVECASFLPEICAENAFSQMRYAESVNISVGGRKEKTYYKSQLADYGRIRRALFELFNEGVFGSDTDAVFKKYVEGSAIMNMVRQAQEKGGNIKGTRLAPLLFRIDEEFCVR